MSMNPNRVLKTMAGAAMAVAMAAAAQTPATPAPAPAPAPAAAPTWSVGMMDLSGYVDGYYSYNANRPSNDADGQVNQLYNFNDKTDQFNLSALKLTLNHNADPVGARVDLIYGRTDDLMNGTDTSAGTGKYIEQAYMSLVPPKAKGLELDFGKFVTSAGAEVIESYSNWNYSRSLLFVNAIPYFHFGLRSSMPLSKTETVGVQVVNGWNNISSSNGGVTIGLTSAYTKPKYTWDLNYYTGPANTDTQKGYKNLVDTTLLLTPNAKFNAYLNYDYGQNRTAACSSPGVCATSMLDHWQGFAVAAHEQLNATSALAARVEYFADPQGTQTIFYKGQDVKEGTLTYEYKWAEGLLSRIEYRRDWSNQDYFVKGNGNYPKDYVGAQSTLTASFVAFFGPKR